MFLKITFYKEDFFKIININLKREVRKEKKTEGDQSKSKTKEARGLSSFVELTSDALAFTRTCVLSFEVRVKNLGFNQLSL